MLLHAGEDAQRGKIPQRNRSDSPFILDMLCVISDNTLVEALLERSTKAKRMGTRHDALRPSPFTPPAFILIERILDGNAKKAEDTLSALGCEWVWANRASSSLENQAARELRIP
jgi:hypothetical protein